MKHVIIIVIIALLIVGGFVYFGGSRDKVVLEPVKEPEPVENTNIATTTPSQPKSVIGKSVEGRDIKIATYGTGQKEILVVGGIHGGYEWNTVLLSYKLMDYLKTNPDAIPEGLKVSVIPVLNPDGLYKTVGTTEGDFSISDIPPVAETASGRFNANNVDLNRNFDCNWQKDAKWQSKTISAGEGAFSEPESQALRDYVTSTKPIAAITLYSAANGVYASACGSISSGTRSLLDTYSKASGYPAYDKFSAYTVTGDAGDWMAKIGIPSISILLATHTSIEWDKNLKGITAVLESYK